MRSVSREGQAAEVGRSVTILRNPIGAFHLPMMILLTLLTFAGFGTWGVLRHWRQLTELQTSLDRCVGESALDLKRTLNRIEFSNRRIQELRIAIASTPLPAAQAPLRLALTAAVRYQDIELLRWKGKRTAWIAKMGCGGGGRHPDMPRPLPAMNWERSIPDGVGERGLTWPAGTPTRLKIQLSHSPRAAAAHVLPKSTVAIRGFDWKAQWAAPEGP